MYDPSTVAFTIRYPWPWPRQKCLGERKAPRAPLITVWHQDPERDGSDDSCDWSWRRLSADESRAAHNLWDNETDNLRVYLRHLGNYDRSTLLECQWQRARRFYRPRPWYRHPRWHLHHWRLQLHPLQHLKRWLWSRCARCGKRFSWGYAPLALSWAGSGPRWFRGEVGVVHHHCGQSVAASAAPAVKS